MTIIRERLISADDHVDVSHDVVKVAPGHEVPRRLRRRPAALPLVDGEHRVGGRERAVACAAGPRARSERGHGQEPASRGQRASRSFRGRGAPRRHGRRRRRGVGELLRGQLVPVPLPHRATGGGRRRVRSTTTLGDFAAADPKRLIVSYQIPIHDIEAAVAEVQWAASVGCKSLQLPVYPAELGVPDYWDERYDPLFGRHPGDRPPDLLPHRHEHTARRPRASRPHAAEGHLRADGRPVGGGGARHVGHGRRVRALPAPQGRVRRTRARVGAVVARTSPTT